jgi:guanosine-3',5'-bis(diphosphate) 3'-pyrophosphohydrolase
VANEDLVLRAISFATRAHRHQFRKDGVTPYSSHPMRVCFVLRHVFQVEDEEILAAAVLHDTIEDTHTDYDDLLDEFGPNVATWVALLSKDKRRVESEREELFRQQIAAAPWQVHLCKLADLYDNLLDCASLSAEQVDRAHRRTGMFLQKIAVDHHDRTEFAGKQVRLLLERMLQRSGKTIDYGRKKTAPSE